MYRLLIIKRIIEDIIIFPFILTGRLIAYLKPLPAEYRVFYFFPFFHTGGAEKVHGQIAQATGGTDCIIFFTRKSADTRFADDFKKSGGAIKDISKYTDNKFLYLLNLVYRGIISGYINRQKSKPIVFNGQCNFGYKISPWIRKDARQLELIHSLNSFSYIRIPFLPFITKTVMISKRRIEDHIELYKKYAIPVSFEARIEFISNAIEIPESVLPKTTDTFNVLFVGRYSPEKRVPLILRIAGKVFEKDPAIRFELICDVPESEKQGNHPNVHFRGNVSDQSVINGAYSSAHILLLVSTAEGFPMVVIEAMAHGCAVLSTAVGDIPLHIVNEKNGALFNAVNDENLVIQQAAEQIISLKNNPALLDEIFTTNQLYAKGNFGIQQFNKEYKRLFSAN